MNDKSISKELSAEYHAFMLRLHRRGSDPQWVLTLEDPHTRERRNFKNVELFVVYLLTLIGQDEFNLDRYQRIRRNHISRRQTE